MPPLGGHHQLLAISLKKILILTTALAATATNIAFAAVNLPSPTIQYTPEQHQICGPILLTDTDGEAEKSSVGESVTATATSHITAPEGYFFDTREGAVAFTQDGKHLNRPGQVRTTKRINDILPLELTLKSEAYRGASLRFGRNASAYNGIAGFAVKKTAACLTSLGLI